MHHRCKGIGSDACVADEKLYVVAATGGIDRQFIRCHPGLKRERTFAYEFHDRCFSGRFAEAGVRAGFDGVATCDAMLALPVEAEHHVVFFADSQLELGVNIYPNPASNFIIIEANKEMSKVFIFRIDGQLILSQEVVGSLCKIELSGETQSCFL